MAQEGSTGAAKTKCEALQRIARLSVPSVATSLCSIALPTFVLALVGTRSGGATGSSNDVDLAAMGLGNVFCNVTGRSLVWGSAGAMDTLATQAWGARRQREVGHILRRAMLVLLLVAGVPLCLLWLFARPLLLALSFSADVADLTQSFAYLTMPGLLAQALGAPYAKYLSAQGKFRPCTVAQAASTLVAGAVAVPLVRGPLGFYGAPIATSLRDVLNTGLLWAYTRRDAQCKACWGDGWDRQALRHWRPFLRLALPSCLLMCVEWWSWEIATFMVGYLGTVPLSAQTVVTTVLNVFYVTTSGIQAATVTVVGNALGAGDGRSASTASWVALFFGLACSVLACGLYLLGRQQVAAAFATDPAIVAAIVALVPLSALFAMLDSGQNMMTGILTATGAQRLGAPVIVVAYWVLALPLAWVLAFKLGCGLDGVWYGMLAGVALHNVAFLAILLRTDWCTEAAKATDAATKAAAKTERLLPEADDCDDHG